MFEGSLTEPRLFVVTGSFSLSINNAGANAGGEPIKHYVIHKDDDHCYYVTKRDKFKTLAELVNHYRGKQSVCSVVKDPWTFTEFKNSVVS